MDQVMDFVRQNPSASAVDVIKHFEDVMEIPKQIRILRTEADDVKEQKFKLRPTYAKRIEVEEKMKYIISDIEGQIFLEYPPRKGSDSQRESMRMKLQDANPEYLSLKKEYNSYSDDIMDIEDQIKYIEMASKSARRLTELFEKYLEFITAYTQK